MDAEVWSGAKIRVTSRYIGSQGDCFDPSKFLYGDASYLYARQKKKKRSSKFRSRKLR